MKKTKLWYLLCLLLLGGLAVEVVVLSVHNRRQKDFLVKLLEEQGLLADRPALNVGDRLPSLQLVGVDGGEETLHFGRQQPSRLLLVFNTRCPACAESVDGWNRLQQSTYGRLEMVAVSNDDGQAIAAYAQENQLRYPVFSLRDASYREALKVSFVPHTILVAPTGTVLGVWAGPLGEEQLRFLEDTSLELSPPEMAADCGC